MLPYNLEGAECRRIDSLATCNPDSGDHLLTKGDVKAGSQAAYVSTDADGESTETWYANLINKLKR